MQIPKINCIHYNEGNCDILPRKFFRLFRSKCVEWNYIPKKLERCDMKIKHKRPIAPPPPLIKY